VLNKNINKQLKHKSLIKTHQKKKNFYVISEHLFK
jgi:hypothetical protein